LLLLYFISLLSAGLMKLKVDVIVNPVLFEEEDTGLVELAIALEDEDKYPFVRLRNDRVLKLFR
jgi:hypothetical protein